MKDVRTVRMNQDARVVVAVVCVAADMRASLDDQYTLIERAREAFGQYATGKARSDDQIVNAAERM